MNARKIVRHSQVKAFLSRSVCAQPNIAMKRPIGIVFASNAAASQSSGTPAVDHGQGSPHPSDTYITSSPYITHHSDLKTPYKTTNFLNNELVQSTTSKWIDLHDPASQKLVTRVPESTREEMIAAVDSAEVAFKSWKKTSLLHRQQIMFKFAHLVRQNMDRIAASITLEQVLI